MKELKSEYKEEKENLLKQKNIHIKGECHLCLRKENLIQLNCERIEWSSRRLYIEDLK